MSETEILPREVTLNTAPSGTQGSPWGGVKTSPWGGVNMPPWGSPAAPACSLEDVMSEELVKQLVQQEEQQQDGDSR